MVYEAWCVLSSCLVCFWKLLAQNVYLKCLEVPPLLGTELRILYSNIGVFLHIWLTLFIFLINGLWQLLVCGNICNGVSWNELWKMNTLLRKCSIQNTCEFLVVLQVSQSVLNPTFIKKNKRHCEFNKPLMYTLTTPLTQFQKHASQIDWYFFLYKLFSL